MRLTSARLLSLNILFSLIVFSFVFSFLFESLARVSVLVQGPAEVARPTTAPAQATLTSICCGLAFWVLARCTVSTPSLNSALTLAGLASSGSEKLRPKLP